MGTCLNCILFAADTVTFHFDRNVTNVDDPFALTVEAYEPNAIHNQDATDAPCPNWEIGFNTPPLAGNAWAVLAGAVTFQDASALVTSSGVVRLSVETLAAVATGATSIGLTWSLIECGGTEVVVEKSTNQTDWTAISGSPFADNTVSADATGLSAGTTYYFRARQTISAGPFVNSTTANATTDTAPLAPQSRLSVGLGLGL